MSRLFDRLSFNYYYINAEQGRGHQFIGRAYVVQSAENKIGGNHGDRYCGSNNKYKERGGDLLR